MKFDFKVINWIPVFLIIIFFSLFVLMYLSEWWNVAILEEIDKYPWGPINDNAWFYETPSLYAFVNLFEGALLLFLLIMSIKNIFQNKHTYKNWLWACFFLLLMSIISSQIK